MRIFFIGDIIGRPGRTIVSENLPEIKKELEIDIVIANGENASGGVGLVLHNARSLFEAGIDVITSGNHIFQHKGFEELFDEYTTIIRPANYPPNIPGKGIYIIKRNSSPHVAIINLIGRTFMDAVDCPFQTIDKILFELSQSVKIVIVDFHAEATSEKVAMGWYLDGRVSAVLGTHTHVQTSDERILPKGTAYITDVGMAGPVNSIIGMEADSIITRYLTKLPVKFSVAKGPSHLDAVLLDIDNKSGRAKTIDRIRFRYGLNSINEHMD